MVHRYINVAYVNITKSRIMTYLTSNLQFPSLSLSLSLWYTYVMAQEKRFFSVIFIVFITPYYLYLKLHDIY